MKTKKIRRFAEFVGGAAIGTGIVLGCGYWFARITHDPTKYMLGVLVGGVAQYILYLFLLKFVVPEK